MKVPRVWENSGLSLAAIIWISYHVASLLLKCQFECWYPVFHFTTAFRWKWKWNLTCDNLTKKKTKETQYNISKKCMQYTNPGFQFSLKSQCFLVSNLLKQPIRFHKNSCASTIHQDKLDPRRFFFLNGRQAPDWCIEIYFESPIYNCHNKPPVIKNFEGWESFVFYTYLEWIVDIINACFSNTDFIHIYLMK